MGTSYMIAGEEQVPSIEFCRKAIAPYSWSALIGQHFRFHMSQYCSRKVLRRCGLKGAYLVRDILLMCLIVLLASARRLKRLSNPRLDRLLCRAIRLTRSPHLVTVLRAFNHSELETLRLLLSEPSTRACSNGKLRNNPGYHYGAITYEMRAGYVLMSQIACKLATSMQHNIGVMEKRLSNLICTQLSQTMTWVQTVNQAGQIAWDQIREVLKTKETAVIEFLNSKTVGFHKEIERRIEMVVLGAVKALVAAITIAVTLGSGWLYASGNMPQVVPVHGEVVKAVNTSSPRLASLTYHHSHRVLERLRNAGIMIPCTYNERVAEIRRIRNRVEVICDAILFEDKN